MKELRNALHLRYKWSSKTTKPQTLSGVSICVCVCVFVCVASLAMLRVHFPVCSGSFVVFLYDTHETEPLGRS